MLESPPSRPFTAVADNATPGLVGTIGVRVKIPGGAVVTPRTTAGITEDVSGVYSASLTAPATAGYYLVIWDDGASHYAEELLYVAYTVSSAASSAVLTLDEVKAVLDIDSTDTSQDAKLNLAITGATQAIKSFTGRDFGTAEVDKSVTYQYDRSGWLEIDDASAVTSVTLDGLTLIAGRDYVLGPDRGYLAPGMPLLYEWVELRPGRGLDPASGFLQGYDSWLLYPTSTSFPNTYSSVVVTGTFGFDAVPSDVKQAAIWTAIEFITVPQPFSHATIGTYSIDQSRAMTDAIPPRAKELLAPYRRMP